MEELSLVAIMLCILAAAGISKRIRNTILSLPMVYVALGFLLSSRVFGIVHLDLDNEIVRVVAEATLVLVLAADARATLWQPRRMPGEKPSGRRTARRGLRCPGLSRPLRKVDR